MDVRFQAFCALIFLFFGAFQINDKNRHTSSINQEKHDKLSWSPSFLVLYFWGLITFQGEVLPSFMYVSCHSSLQVTVLLPIIWLHVAVHIYIVTSFVN